MGHSIQRYAILFLVWLVYLKLHAADTAGRDRLSLSGGRDTKPME